MAEQADHDDMQQQGNLDPGIGSSAINSPASSPPRDLINMHSDILENIFLRIPSHEYPQIRATCRALNALLTKSIFIYLYIEEVIVKRGEIIIPVKLRLENHAARYKNRCTDGVSWRLGCNLGSCYYRCYNTRQIRQIRLTEAEAESPTPIPCHDGLFCSWIECGRLHRWFDGGFVHTFLRNKAPEFESNTRRRWHPKAHKLCSVCSHARSTSCSSCMASLLYIKNPITGIYKRLPTIDGRWTSKLKCIATYGRDHFKVLVAMPVNTHKGIHCVEHISFVKTMIYDSIIDSWKRLKKYSHYRLRNIKVVDTHGVYCRGTMYWLLEVTQSLLVFQVENERWEILNVRNSPPGHPLGLVAYTEYVLMVKAQGRVLVIWKLIHGNSLNQSHNEQGLWVEISRSTEEIFRELQATEMVIHSACSPSGDDIVCFENLLKRTAVTYNVTIGLWGRSNDIHGF